MAAVLDVRSHQDSFLKAVDPWADPGLLAYRDPANCDTPAAPQTLREFIREAFPRYGFHRWAELLIERLQAVADGELGRLIVTCPPRLGKSLLVSKLFPAYFIQRHPQLFAAIASYSAELAYAHSREARHYYRITGNSLSKDSAAVGNWLPGVNYVGGSRQLLRRVGAPTPLPWQGGGPRFCWGRLAGN